MSEQEKLVEGFLLSVNSAQDRPDDRDIHTEELFGAPVYTGMPASASVDLIPFLNQWSVPACTIFGHSGALFNTIFKDCLLNGTEYKQPYDPWKAWDQAITRGASTKWGWYVQAALKLIKDMGFSKGYALVGNRNNANVDALKYWIWQGRAITTWSTYWDWGKIIRTGIYSESSKEAGHCWQFSKYDDNQIIGNERGGFYSPNSWNGHGAFWLPYSMVDKLFTQYIALWPADLEALKNLQNKRTQEYLKKSAHVWNAKNANDIASPFEIATMINRALKFLGNQKRQRYIEIFEEKILRGAGVMQISNGKELGRTAKDQEIAVMFTNAVTREPYTALKLTRLQVATVIGRDLC